MKFNAWALIAQILAEVPAILAVQPGDSETLPTIHIKSGTTTVDVVLTVKQDPKK